MLGTGAVYATKANAMDGEVRATEIGVIDIDSPLIMHHRVGKDHIGKALLRGFVAGKPCETCQTDIGFRDSTKGLTGTGYCMILYVIVTFFSV